MVGGVESIDSVQLRQAEQNCFNINQRKCLFTGTVPVNKNYRTGTVPVNKNNRTGTVPENKNYRTGTVPVNKNYPTGAVPLNKNYPTGTLIHKLTIFSPKKFLPVCQ